MKKETRTSYTVKNAKVSLLFFVLGTLLAFFSRKIFLEELGNNFLGLTGTLNNILGLLNLAELGVGAAISFLLFEPLQKGDKVEIAKLISMLGVLYKRIGYTITILAIFISLFIPIVFKSADMNLGIIYFAYYSFLISTLLSYFLNYKQILLTANQKNYIVSSYFQSGIMIKTIIQIIIVYFTSNCLLWILMELLFGLVYCKVINWRIRKEYPWLLDFSTCDLPNNSEYLKIKRYVKLIFIHKIKDFVLTQSDQIFIFMFVSLKMVAYYGNYVLVINKLSQIFTKVLDGIVPSIGNLVVEGNKSKIVDVFWELSALRYFIAGALTYVLYVLLQPLIILWLGQEYLLSNQIMYAFLLIFFITQSRGAVDSFNSAYGLYADTWSAWTEGGINVLITVVLGYKMGIMGILLGKIVSLLLIIVLWKPYYLFNSGINLSVKLYWKNTFKYYSIILVSILLAELYRKIIKIEPQSSISDFICYSILVLVPFIILLFALFYKFTAGGKMCFNRFKFVLSKYNQ